MKKPVNLVLMAIFATLLILLAVQPYLTRREPVQINKNLPTVKMKIGNRMFTLEVADTDETRETGLMNRESMAEDHGMIFVYDEDEPLNFWMKNTLIGLDIIYVNSKGKVVSIDRMKPRDTITRHDSAAPARYAIELNEGMAAKAGVKAGDVLEIPRLREGRK